MKTNSIKANALLNIIYTISNIIFPMITFPYVSRILLADGMGKISFFTAFANYAIMIASLGISTYGIRKTASVRNNKSELSKVTFELLLINFIMSIIVIILIILSIPFVDKFNNDKLLLLINCVMIFCSSFSLNWFYSGLEQYSYITKRSILFKVISLILVFMFVHSKNDYNKYAAITVFSTSISYIINLWYSRYFVSFKNIKNISLKKHFKPMLFLFASILAVNIYTNLDTVMLGFISTNREVGLYTVASKIKWLLLSVVNSISAVLLPRLSYYLSENRTSDFHRILRKSISIIFMISIPLTSFFILEAKDSVIILGGQDYSDASLCMQIIMPILLISGFSNITGNQILIPLGKDKCFMEAVIMGAVTDLLLNLLLMPTLASVGAAIATLIAECVQMIVQLRYSKEYIINNIDISAIFKMIIAALISLIFTLVIRQKISCCLFENTILDSIVNMIIYASAYFIIYFLFLIIFREKNIKDFLSSYIKRR